RSEEQATHTEGQESHLPKSRRDGGDLHLHRRRERHLLLTGGRRHRLHLRSCQAHGKVLTRQLPQCSHPGINFLSLFVLLARARKLECFAHVTLLGWLVVDVQRCRDETLWSRPSDGSRRKASPWASR